jgi:hypothetical protein
MQVGTPSRGSAHFIRAKYAAPNRTTASHSGIYS